ncbi:hypothetical protein B0T26DRAFT_654770 [Lasiosphaeria miniovina]|uniref:Protein prenyltransferase n=1 Tax=Lasiosphaeria miniovina TaxID=1954250 RepID=A0AA40A073_9PEZI|nr:uncharacterized protein B0T26DRAFT_654770 [Lasiosphaeria miniovina]KAK0706800.1 hypothetical protein B0T26DRAFT_654770 [Lasiosphaeria miniovina]
MSRALDQDVAESLEEGNRLDAYEAISALLLSRPGGGLLELEILGKSFPMPDGLYVLQDGRAAGVSKVGLVQAFLVARQKLAAHLHKTAALDDGELFSTTAVILLMDPEYLTAANTRKRLLQKLTSRRDSTCAAVLENEKHFVDSLLTSRLHRHTKSPTLWSHRRWLVRLCRSLDVSVDVASDVVHVVSVAGERHPRNYYAWCHARFLSDLDPEDQGGKLLAAVKDWCWKHHTDISGWSFLYYLLSARGSPGSAASSATFSQVLERVRSLRLANESVWVFLRTLAASGLVGEKEYAELVTVGHGLSGAAAAPTDQRVLRSAMEWCDTYRLGR